MWDLAVRVLHWSLVLTVAAAWLTRHSPGRWHEWLGYATLVIVAARFVGFLRLPPRALCRLPAAGSRDARVRARRLSAREARFVGHNPLGGWMVVALLAMVVFVGFTGWLYTTDRFWGVGWVEELHETLSDILFAFVGLHILGVVFTSIRHRENLPAHAAWPQEA